MRRVAPSMRLGFSLPVAGAWATPANQVRVAQQAERLGYHSLWVLQRLLYPVVPQNDYPAMPGKTWPECFESVADPVVSLAFVAGATSRMSRVRARTGPGDRASRRQAIARTSTTSSMIRHAMRPVANARIAHRSG